MVSYFDNQAMYQILLKYNNQTELSVKEKQELDYWVYVYDHRNKLFKHLTYVIELQNELKAVVHVNDLFRLIQKIKGSVPLKYMDISNKNDFHSIHAAVTMGLRNYSAELVLRMIRGHMWGGIIVALSVLILVVFILFMVIWFS